MPERDDTAVKSTNSLWVGAAAELVLILCSLLNKAKKKKVKKMVSTVGGVFLNIFSFVK